MKTWHVRKVTNKDIPNIHQLLKNTIYYGYPYSLDRCISEIDSSVVAYVIVNHNEIVGVSIICERENKTLEWKALAVNARYRGQSLGKHLVHVSVKDLKDVAVFAECWIHPTTKPNEATSDILFKKAGFIEVFHSDSHWSKRCDSVEDFCPHRSNRGCMCTTKIMMKVF